MTPSMRHLFLTTTQIRYLETLVVRDHRINGTDNKDIITALRNGQS